MRPRPRKLAPLTIAMLIPIALLIAWVSNGRDVADPAFLPLTGIVMACLAVALSFTRRSGPRAK